MNKLDVNLKFSVSIVYSFGFDTLMSQQEFSDNILHNFHPLFSVRSSLDVKHLS